MVGWLSGNPRLNSHYRVYITEPLSLHTVTVRLPGNTSSNTKRASLETHRLGCLCALYLIKRVLPIYTMINISPTSNGQEFSVTTSEDVACTQMHTMPQVHFNVLGNELTKLN